MDLVVELLRRIGEDPTRQGLLETPERVAKAWDFWCKGYNEDPASVLKAFEDGACDEMVFQGGLSLWSMCEHHMAPFFGVAHIGYIPNKRVVGLSKLARVTDVFARRLQVQERLTGQIADAIMEHLDPLGVGVVLQCRHTCMESRGVQRRGTITDTTALRGCMKQGEARTEFLLKVQTASNGLPPL